MVNLFSLGCYVICRAYVRTYASKGRVEETINREGGVSQACLGKSTSCTLDIHKMVNWQPSKQDSHWPVSHDHMAGSCVNSSTWRVFWKLSADQLIAWLDRNRCLISYSLAHVCTHIGHQCCDQLTAVKTGYPLTSTLDRIAGSGVDPSRSSIFWSYPL